MIACRLQLVRTGFEREIHIEMLRTYAFDLSTTLACLALHMAMSFLAQLLLRDRPGGAGKAGMESCSGAKRGVIHEYDRDVGARAEGSMFSVEDAFVICLKCFRAKRFWVLG